MSYIAQEEDLTKQTKTYSDSTEVRPGEGKESRSSYTYLSNILSLPLILSQFLEGRNMFSQKLGIKKKKKKEVRSNKANTSPLNMKPSAISLG